MRRYIHFLTPCILWPLSRLIRLMAWVKLPYACLSILLLCIVSVGDAKTPVHQAAPMILYQKPNLQSAIVLQLSTGHPLIPVYHDKAWVKVADPQTGKVGWMPEEAFKFIMPVYHIYWQKDNTMPASGLTQSYHMIEYSGTGDKLKTIQPTTLQTKKWQKKLKEMQRMQANMQQAMDQLMHDNIQMMQEMEHHFWKVQQLLFDLPAHQSGKKNATTTDENTQTHVTDLQSKPKKQTGQLIKWWKQMRQWLHTSTKKDATTSSS